MYQTLQLIAHYQSPNIILIHETKVEQFLFMKIELINTQKLNLIIDIQ